MRPGSRLRGGFLRLAVAAIFVLFGTATFAQARPYTLQWDANSDGLTAGYLISYGSAAGSYGSTADIDVGNATSFQVDLLPGTTYYFIVKAYTATRVVGPPSAELSFFVPNATLSVSATSVSPGATVSTSLLNGPGNPQDRIGLFAVGSSTQLDWKYLNGSQTAPTTGTTNATVSFAMPSTPGQYAFLFIPSGSTSPLATSPTVTVATAGAPTVAVSATSVSAGANVSATVGNGPGNPQDRIGLFAVGSSTQLSWKYLNGSQTAPGTGLTNATVSFAMPTGAGQYNFRLLAGGSGTTLATSAAVTVTSSTGGGGGGTAPSITVSSTSVAAGGSLSGTVANGPGNVTDWVGLYAVGSTTLLDWKYLNGTRTPPSASLRSATVSFTAPTTAGTYNLQFFPNNSFTLLATSATVTVTGGTGGGGGGSTAPSIALSATSVSAGGSVTGTVANGPGNVTDWVGLYAVGSSTLLDWKYLNGTRVAPSSGLRGAAVTFTAPTTAGSYELRFFPNNSFTLLATSPTLTVTSSGGGGGGSTTPSVAISATSVAPGASFTASVANGPGGITDWVGVYAVGSTTLIDWKYLNGTRVAPSTGLRSAAVTFTAPTTGGTYEVRFFPNNSFTLLATSPTLTVTSSTGGGGGGAASLTLSATSAVRGTNLIATVVGGPGNRTDWVGVYAVGSSTLLDWKYLSNTQVPPSSGLTIAAVAITAPATPGTYEVRFFSNNTYTLLATSRSFTSQ